MIVYLSLNWRNGKVEKLLMIMQVHQLLKQGFKVAGIAKKLGISRTTVYKYKAMTFEDASDWVSTLDSRTKKLDPYRDTILSWLKEHNDLSSAQVEDRLIEKYPSIDVGESTIRLYVRELRELYHIPKCVHIRDFEAVEELPMGHQAQVDWGEITVKNVEKKNVKLYFISFVLSHSRFKYAEWQDRPFATKDAIRCHENAFRHYGGMPEEIVYDQDHLITVSENAGDIILTGEFQTYRKERGFRVYLCRKADPQSKGKIENVVKYIKNNFAKHRVFTTVDTWNEKCMAWLERTGNYKVHHTTKKRPVEVHALEKPYLKPISTTFSIENNHTSSIARIVHKDNIIMYRSNRYSLPLGTYRPKGDNTVYVEICENDLIIRATPQGEVLAKHQLCLNKGQLVKNKQHTRDRSKGIRAYKETIIRQFSNQENAIKFIDELSSHYSRYIRDQLDVMQSTITKYRDECEEALAMSIRDKLWSANDFRDIAQHLKRTKEATLSQPVDTPSAKCNAPAMKMKAAMRDVTDYLKILGGA